MALKTRNWDPAELLRNEADDRLFLEEMMSDDDPAEIAEGILVVARARGMREIATEAGISLERLHDLLNPYDKAFDHSAILALARKLDTDADAKPGEKRSVKKRNAA